jgi:hypothetical protein
MGCCSGGCSCGYSPRAGTGSFTAADCRASTDVATAPGGPNDELSVSNMSTVLMSLLRSIVPYLSDRRISILDWWGRPESQAIAARYMDLLG